MMESDNADLSGGVPMARTVQRGFDPAVPTTDVGEAWRRFYPARALPAGSPWWVDSSKARDAEDIVAAISRRIERASSAENPEDPSCLHELVAGHRGCGKSTELLRLKQRLEEQGFLVSYFAVTDYIDEQDVEYGDVLLAVARQAFADLARARIKLAQNLLESLNLWFAEKVRERVTERVEDYKVEVEGQIGVQIPVLKVLARCLAAIRGKEQTRTTVREMVSDSIEELMSRINEILLSAQAELRRSQKRGLVIIVDNLDRVPDPDQQKRIFVDHADQLNRLACHCLYTVPTSLIYSPEGRPVGTLFRHLHFLPVVKVMEKDGQDFEPGLAALRQIVHRRAAEGMFEPGVVETLCRFSGGHARDLVRLVASACDVSLEPPVTMEAARHACQSLTRDFERWLTDADLTLLRRLTDDPEREMDKDQEHKRLLFYGAILPYWNGTSWYEVHPAVRALPKFRPPGKRRKR
jgi:hypothetical protein